MTTFGIYRIPRGGYVAVKLRTQGDKVIDRRLLEPKPVDRAIAEETALRGLCDGEDFLDDLLRA